MTRPSWHRIHVHSSPRVVGIADHRSGGDRSRWINSAIERYAAICDAEKPELKWLFTQAQAAEMIAATASPPYNHEVIHWLIISVTTDIRLSQLMHGLHATQRCVLCECLDSWHRRNATDSTIQPTAEELFR